MAEHPNVSILQKGYAAFQSGDLDTVRALFTDDIEWHLPGNNRFSGTRRGVDNVLALFLEQMQETDGTFKVQVHDILANDEHGVVLATVSGKRNGKELEDHYTQTCHMKAGKMSQSWIFGEHQDKVDDFWK